MNISRRISPDTGSLEAVGKRLASALRLESGIDAETRVDSPQKPTMLIFTTPDASTPILQRFLGPVLDSAACPCTIQREGRTTIDLEPFSGSNQKGAVALRLTPPLIERLVSKL